MKTFLILSLALAAVTPVVQGQGSLTPPPGVPGPVMKTLDQIEARTPIPATVTPGPGPHFTITQPGSYYLTGNITVTTGNGISITAASDVSIDLNGFTISSTLVGSSIGGAISSSNSFRRLTVYNGNLKSGSTPPNIQGFAYGIFASNDDIAESCIRNVNIDGVGLNGIFANLSIVENCVVTRSGWHGMYLSNSIVKNCTAKMNGGAGIVNDNGTVVGCTSTSNVTSGIIADRGAVTGCASSGNGNDGISANNGIVSHCRVFNNTQNGISVGVGVADHCVATGNDTGNNVNFYQIKVSAGGQRVACVPATEAGSP